MPRWPKLTAKEYVDKWVKKLSNGCWKYKGRICPWGYGRHKHFYQKIGGKIVPKGLQLDHLCRNRYCVNPNHLEPVTIAENIRRGSAAKLNKEQAEEIILLKRMGLRQVDLAKMYNVQQCNISRIINGLRWGPNRKEHSAYA